MKRGATLISTLVGIALLAATLAGTVHICTLAGMAVSVAGTRTAALMIAETRIETLVAKGYEELPSIGLHEEMMGVSHDDTQESWLAMMEQIPMIGFTPERG